MSQTAIVFLEDQILAASGREGSSPKLTRVERVKLSGQGDAMQRWQQALESLSPSWRKAPVQLVLPAGMCSARVLKLPYARGRQLSAMAGREVEDSFKSETAGYFLLESDRKAGLALCAGGADEKILQQFAEICRQAGFTIGRITVPMEGQLNLLRQLESYRSGTAIHLFFEEGSVTSILSQDGRYLYSGRSRLFSEPGTLDFGTEIVRSLSGILQFYASAKKEQPITDVYYTGCPESDFEAGLEGIKELGLTAKPLSLGSRIAVPEGESAADWAACIGALTRPGRGDKRLDLYRKSKQLSEQAQKKPGILRQLALPVAVLILCLLPTAAIRLLNMQVQREMAGRQQWIDSPQVQEEYGRALALQEKLAGIEGNLAAVEQAGQNLAGYPQLSAKVLRSIENAGEEGIACAITGYDAATGRLSLEASSREVIDVPAYIQKLQDNALFHLVEYQGYAYAEDWYTLRVSCTLEGRQPQEGDTK